MRTRTKDKKKGGERDEGSRGGRKEEEVGRGHLRGNDDKI